MYLRQSGQEAHAAPGELLLFSSSRPYQGHRVSGGGMVAATDLVLPRSLVPASAAVAVGRLPLLLPGSQTVVPLLAQLLGHLSTRTTGYGAQASDRLGSAALDLAVVALAALDGGRAADPETRQRVLATRIQTFIARHLGDPGLTPATIAAAHHISLRSLHRIYQHQGTTVAASIRHQRLEHTRRELADPAQLARPIHAIAARWGFCQPADFSRSFRHAYGLSPSDYRAARTGTQG